MMRQQPGVKSQPKLLTRNKSDIPSDQQSREQLKMPQKLASIKYVNPTFKSDNKQNESQNYLNYLNKLGQDNGTPSRSITQIGFKKTKVPTPTNSKQEQYVRKLYTSNEKEERSNYYPVRRVPAGTTLQSTGLGNCTLIMTRTRDQNDLRKCQFMQIQEKVKDLESKILRIKEAIEKKPERILPLATNTPTRNYQNMKTQTDISQPVETSKLEKSSKTARSEKSSNKIEKIDEKSQPTIISSFVTQAPAPSQLLQCSSQTNLFSVSRQTKPTINKYYISSILPAFFDKTNNTSFMQLCRNHLSTSLQLLRCTKNIEKPRDVLPIRPLPKSTKLNTIVFDLDETLIHCNENIDIPHDTLLSIVFPNGESTKAGINVRPHAIQCLRELAEHFQIIVFTASHECYGNVVVDYLDPKKEFISHMYFRDSCYKSPQGFYIKDLRVIDRSLQRMLLVDNLENGVPIIPFYDCKTDLELKHLAAYLKLLVQSKDIKKENCQTLRFNEYSKFSDPLELINRLYGEFINRS